MEQLHVDLPQEIWETIFTFCEANVAGRLWLAIPQWRDAFLSESGLKTLSNDRSKIFASFSERYRLDSFLLSSKRSPLRLLKDLYQSRKNLSSGRGVSHLIAEHRVDDVSLQGSLLAGHPVLCCKLVYTDLASSYEDGSLQSTVEINLASGAILHNDLRNSGVFIGKDIFFESSPGKWSPEWYQHYYHRDADEGSNEIGQPLSFETSHTIYFNKHADYPQAIILSEPSTCESEFY
jgi:hypothetical protein